MKSTRFQWLAAALVAAAALSACGGSGSSGNDGTGDPGVPDSALSSGAGYTVWVQQMANAPDDGGEPLNVDAIATAPRSETDEPASLD